LSRPAWAEEPDGLRLFVRVTPRARQSALGGIVADAEGQAWLAIKLAAPPVDGAANRALIAFVAGLLDVPRSAVEIVAGETSRLKTVRVRHATAAALGALNFRGDP
jgi:uncharacterized protein